MPAPKPIGKRENKRQTKAALLTALEDRGLKIEEMAAGSVTYHVARWPDENQIICAIYGSLRHAASVWVKEAAFDILKPDLPDDAVVEDVAPFRRGFQWSVHFSGPWDELIKPTLDACVEAAENRLERTLERRKQDEVREAKRKAREAARAASKRDWRTHS